MHGVSLASNPRPVPSCHRESPPLSPSLSRALVEREGPDCPLGTRPSDSKKTGFQPCLLVTLVAALLSDNCASQLEPK